MAEDWIAAERAAGRDVEIQVIGKKGIARFRFGKVEVSRSYTQFGDRPGFRDAEALAADFMKRFLEGAVDRVVVFATRYYSSSLQKPAEMQLLPIAPPKPAGSPGPAAKPSRRVGSIEFIFEPDRETILKALLPLSVKNALYRILLEASASEQIARRIAMKLATDNAEELIRVYTRKYNRQRQAGITQQIMEIVGGAEALE